MRRQHSILNIIKRLIWDLQVKEERKYYWYHFIWQLPGSFGTCLRANFVAKNVKSCGSNLRVYTGFRFRSIEKIELGDNVELGVDAYIQGLGGVTLGNNVMLAPGVKIWSASHNIWDKEDSVNEQGVSSKPIVLEEDVFVGSNSFIMPGVILPKGCIVTAGSVVGVKAYKPYSILSGNPARVVGYRQHEEVAE